MAEIKDIKLEELDKNLKLETKIQKDDIVFYDVRRAPMRLYGLDTPKDGEWFKRMPDEVAKKVILEKMILENQILKMVLVQESQMIEE